METSAVSKLVSTFTSQFFAPEKAETEQCILPIKNSINGVTQTE
jgi:prephenate dehydratase